MIRSPLRQFFDRVYSGGSEKLSVLPADSLDCQGFPHQVMTASSVALLKTQLPSSPLSFHRFKAGFLASFSESHASERTDLSVSRPFTCSAHAQRSDPSCLQLLYQSSQVEIDFLTHQQFAVEIEIRD